MVSDITLAQRTCFIIPGGNLALNPAGVAVLEKMSFRDALNRAQRGQRGLGASPHERIRSARKSSGG
jgi:hypothetical protein